MKKFTLHLSVLLILLLSSFEGFSQVVGNALYFDGNNDYIGTTPPSQGSINILSGTFTVEAWVMPMHATKTMTILSTRQPVDQAFDIKLEGGNSIRVDLGNASGWIVNQSFNYNYEVGKWMHVACVSDNGDYYAVYVNGELIGSGPTNANPMLIDYQHSIQLGTYGTENFQGAMDEVKIFITARSQAEIKADMMMTAPSIDTNYLMSYYDFNEGTAGGNNGGTTHLPDRRGKYNAFTVNFAFNGNTSNWISSFAAVRPTAIAASNRAATQFTANWTAPTNATATDYLLDVSTNSSFSSYVGSYHDVVVSGTSADVTGLTAGTVYYYRVRARNAAQHASVASNVITVANLNILDLAGATSYVAAPAYSLRKLSSSYNGNAINVRRSSDNATQDIGFTSGNLNTAALLAFVGSGSGYVTKWYDQSNAGYHATQSNTSLQPRIVNAGVIEQFNKRYSIYFGTSNLATEKISMFNLGTTFIASAKGTSSTLSTLVSKTGFANGTNTNVPAPFDFTNSSGMFMIGNGTGFGSTTMIGTGVESNIPGSVYSFMMYNNSGNTTAYISRNSNSTGSVSNVYGDGGNSLMIGNRNDNGGSGNMYVAEIIMGNGQTNERYAMETAQVNYYANTNADLSAIALSSGTVNPAVSGSQTNYTAAVTNATTSIVITPTISNATATSISYRIGTTASPTNLTIGASTPALPLNEGNTIIQLFVTAQNGVTMKTYTITVFRGSGNNNLSNLTTSAGPVLPTFASATTSYNTSKTALSSVTVTPTLSDSGATVHARVNGGSYVAVTNGSASSALALNVGGNTVEVRVTAVDATTKTYSIGITRVVPNTLDLIGLTSATPSVPAYSVRKLSSSYNGPAFTVRKTGGTYDYDVNFDTDGNIYEGPLLSYAQGATVYIIKWYDQSGFGYDAVQTNTALQPIIAEAGAIKKINGRPAVYFGTANLATGKQYMFESGASMVGFAKGNSSTPSSMVTKTGTTDGNNLAHPGPFDFTNNGGQFTVGNAATTLFNHIAMSDINPRADVSTTVPASVYAFTIPITGNYTTYRNGAQTATNTILEYKDNGNSLMLGNRNSGGSGGEVYTSEMVLFNAVLTTAQRQAVEAAQTNYYLSANANLTSIYQSTSLFNFSPAFNTNTTSYTATVSSGTTSLQVGGTPSSAFATVKVRSNNGTFLSVNSQNYTTVSLVEGINPVEVQVTSQGGTVKTYTISVLVLSDNANLSGLTTTAGSIAFDQNTTSYTGLSTPLTSITITPTAAQSNATIRVRINSGSYTQVASGAESIPLALPIGGNNIYIEVTAQNGYSTKNYQLAVYRKSNNANLRTFTSPYVSIPFSEATQSYAVSVPSYNPSFTFNTSVYTNATMALRLNGGSYSTVTPGNHGPFVLSIGANTFDIKITAEDGITEKVYTLAVTKISNNATLSALATSPSGLITFASGTETYNANVSNATSSMTVTPTAAYETSTMQISLNGAAFTTISNNSSSGTLNLNVGLNTIAVKVTAEDSSFTKTYTLNITRVSNNADLSALTSTAGSFAFASGTTQYNLAPVSNATASVTVRPTVLQANATVQVRVNNGSYTTVSSGSNSAALPLTVGNNDIDVLVTAQDGTTTKSYRISVRRQSNDATLAALATSPANIISFASATETYSADVSNATASITLTPKVTHSNALIQINVNGGSFSPINDNTTSGALNLNVGQNTILVKVTAEDSSFTKTYTLNLTRLSNDASLSALTTTAGSFTFSSGTQSYNLASVSNATTSVTIKPTATNPNATILVRINDGTLQSVNSGSNSTALPLAVGTNIIDVIVSAQDGTSKAYTLTFRRKSNDASLSALAVSAGTLSFAPATLSYSISVASPIETINVTPTAGYPSHSVISARVNNGSYTTVNSGNAYAASLIFGINTVHIKVVSEDGNEQVYTISVSRLSDNANLSSLTTTAGPISFSANTPDYSKTVGFNTTSVTVTPTAAQANAVIDVRINNGSFNRLDSGNTSGELALNLGSNQIDIQVMSQNGTFKGYSITVFRQAGDANLSYLYTSIGTPFTFVQATTSYSTTVSNATSTLTVNSVAADANASIQVSVNGGSFSSFETATRSDEAVLNIGTNTVVLKVRAQDTSIEKTYTLTIIRLSNNADLSDLTTTAGNISFAPTTLTYALSVSNATESVSVTPTAAEATQTITVRVNNGNFETVSSGDTAAGLALGIGNNTIDVKVTAQDGTVKTYTISIFRPSNNANLSGLSTSDGSLNSFTPETTEYDITVSNATSLFTLNSTAADPNATIQLNANGAGFTSPEMATRSDAVSLTIGGNVLLVKVIAQDLTEKVYTVNVLRVSNDADLSDLQTSAGTINFTPANANYTVTVPTETDLINVTPTQSHNAATIEVFVDTVSYGFVTSGNAQDLLIAIGDNTVAIKVTAQDGTIKTYTIVVKRKSDDTTLSSLQTDSGSLVPDFSSGTIAYDVTTLSGTENISITAQAGNPGATKEIRINNGTYAALTGNVSDALPLQTGINTIDIQVTSENGSVSVYTITVLRPSADAGLSSLSTSIPGFDLNFDATTTSYATTVNSGTNFVTVAATASDANAVVELSQNGSAFMPFSTAPIALNVGSNSINIRVTAQDGVTVKTYTLTITRTAGVALDVLGLTSATPATNAYSLRKLSSTYSGFAVQVRRSSDNTMQNIGFLPNGNFDSAALLAFAGNSTAYVARWYDQSGSGVDVFQNTESQQPVLATDGILQKFNNKPAIKFDSANLATNAVVLFPYGVSMVATARGIGATPSSLVTKTSSNLPAPFDFTNTGGDFVVGSPASFNSRNTSYYTPYSGLFETVKGSTYAFTIPFSGNYTNYIDGVNAGGNNVVSYSDNGDPLRIGNRNDFGGYSNMELPEIVLFAKALTQQEREAVETSQKNYYQTQAAYLTALTMSVSNFYTAFNGSNLKYTGDIPYASASITVKPVGTGTIEVSVNGGAYSVVSSNTNSQQLPMNFGDNAITIRVTNDNLVTVYTINAIRTGACPYNFNFYSQQDIDNFGNNYPECTTTVQGIYINGANITSLLPLQKLVSVGTLDIRNTSLTNLDGLQNLKKVTNLNLRDNESLLQVDALSGLTELTRLDFNNSNSLTSFAGFQNITKITGPVFLGGFNAATNLNGFQNLKNVSGTINIRNFPILTDISGIENLEPEGITSLNIFYNNALEHANVKSVCKYIAAGGNAQIYINKYPGFANSTADVTADCGNTINSANLSALTTSAGALLVAFDENTTGYTVANVPFATTTTTVTPTVEYPAATVKVRVNGGSYAAVTSGQASQPLSLIEGNNTVDITVTAENPTIEKTYTISINRTFGCPDGPIILTSQAMVDAFITAYPNCTNFIGNLEISGTDITNLAGVATIANINGTLTIHNTNLTSLLGWGNLASVTNLVLTNNPLLTAANIGGICSHLAAGTGTTVIVNNATGSNTAAEILAACSVTYNNADLVSLSTSGGTLSPAFESAELNYTIPTVAYTVASITVTPIAEVPGTVLTARINGGNYSTVTSGSASSAITLADGNNTLEVKATAADGITVKTYSITFIKLTQCPVGDFVLTGQSEVDNFAVTYADCTALNGNLTVSGNVTNLNGLDNLTSISGSLSISNTLVSDISVLHGMSFGSLTIANSPVSSLSDLSGLASLNTLELTNLPITNLNGLESLTTVNHLVLANNTSLTSLSALANVTSPATEVVVDGNTQLTALAGLDNLVLNSAAAVKITNNTQLTYAGVKSICEYIAAGGNATVSNNGSGAGSQSAIQSNCYSTYYNSSILGLVSSTGGVTPTVSWNTYNYALAATSVNENPITITPTTSFAGASIQIKVNNGAYAAGINGGANTITLIEGTNTISIKITAQDGVTTSTYTATVEMTQAPNVLDAVGLASGNILSPAYSVRKLSSTYTGPALRIKNYADQILDVGFTADGDLDTNAILSFSMEGPAFVVTWYDQSGNGINMTQPLISRAPVIANGGNVFKQNNKPVLNFSGSSFMSTTAQVIFPNGASMVGIAQGNSGPAALVTKTGSGSSNTNYPAPFDFTNSGNNFGVGDASTASFTSHNVGGGSVGNSVPQSVYAFTIPNTGGQTARTFRNGSQTGSHILNYYADNGNPLMIGNRNDLGSPSAFYTSELTLFNKVLGDGERNTIEASQRNYYMDTSADLVNLTLSAGTPPVVFAPNVFTYNTAVNNATASVTITPTANTPNGYGIVKINGSQVGYAFSGSPSGAIALNEGDNVIEFISLSNTGATTYTINVARQIVCPQGDIVITNQSELDAFVSLYPECTALNGGLSVIGAADITSLAQLQHLTQIRGNLTISNNPALVSLAGLEGITNVWYDITIGNLPLVASLAPLQNITYVGQGIELSSLAIPSLAGLGGITSVTKLVIDDCDALTDISALANLGTISDALEIRNNALLPNLVPLQQANISGLDNLTVTNNPELVIAVQNVCSYVSDGGTNTISNNAAGSSSASEVTAACEAILTAVNLTSLSTTAGALSPVFDAGTLSYTAPSVSSETIGVTASPLSGTSTLSVQVNYGGWNPMADNVESVLSINAGPNTIQVKVTAASGAEKTYTLTVSNVPVCPSGSVALYSQAAVDNFIIQYPNCTSVAALEIGGNVTNLNGLANLTAVQGTLTIFNTDSLVNLSGLENLTTIGGSLDIYWNTALTTISALTSLQSFNSIYLAGNPVLSDVSITAVCDYLANGNNGVFSGNATGANSRSEVMAACGNADALLLSAIETSFAAIANFDPTGYNFFQTLPGNIDTITVTPTANNPNAVITVTMNGQSQTVQSGSPSGDLAMATGMNYVLVSITVGNSTKDYVLNISKASLCPASSMYFNNQADIDNFMVNYPACTNFNGSLYISGDDITNLDGFSNLVSITDTIRISNTLGLTDLGGLENLTGVGQFYLDGNAALQDISAVSNLDFSGTTGFQVINNPALADIAIPGICDYLATGAYASIWNNAPGANSKTEVMQACGNEQTLGLSALTTSAGAVPGFDPMTNYFELTVLTDTVTITPTAFNPNAVITIQSPNDYETLASGATSQTYSVDYGEYYYYINVTVGSSSMYYTLNIKRNTPCPSGSLYLYSQEDVDGFIVDYPTCTAISGIIYINGSDITNLNGLSNITTVTGGELYIENTGLQNLGGLEAITGLSYTSIRDNDSLTDISALSDAAFLPNGYIGVNNNPTLANASTPGICSYLSDGYDAYFYNNASGADSNDAVMAGCGIVNPSTLTGITTSAGAIAGFDPANEDYTISVTDGASTITITPTAYNPNAVITIYNNNEDTEEIVASGTTSSAYALYGGNNYFTVEVTFGSSYSYYYLKVMKPLNCPSNVYIYSQEDLDDFIQNYPTCTQIDGNVYIEGTDITSLAALSNITSVSGYVEIYDTGIQNLDGLQNIALQNSFYISYNLALTDISAIDTMDLSQTGYISIQNNTNLSNVAYPNLCAYISNGGDIYIDDNAVGAQNIGEVLAACGIVDNSKLLSLATSQGPVPNFDPYNDEYYIGVSTATETITITPTAAHPDATIYIVNLVDDSEESVISGSTSSPLNLEMGTNEFLVIVSEGEFDSYYYMQITRNGACPSGDVVLQGQLEVDNFIAVFPTCTQLPGRLSISGEDVTNLNALQNITSVSGSLSIESTSLTTLSGLENLETIGGTLDISENSLISLSALANLVSIGDAVNISNEPLSNLNGLEGITSLVWFNFESMENLTSLSGLQNLTELLYLSIEDCPLINDLSALSGITTVEDFYLNNLPALQSLNGLQNLASITNYGFYVNNCNGLSDFSGLQNLTAVSGEIYIMQCTGLTSLQGLQNANLGNVTAIEITGNTNLTNASFPNFCSYLTGGGDATVANNNVGANSIAEITAACAAACQNTTTWNGTAWSNGVPTVTTTAIIAGDYTSATNLFGDKLTACALTVSNNAVVIVGNGDTFDINGKVKVLSGSLSFANNARLIQDPLAATNENEGNITSQRNVMLRRLDYVYWGSPVAGMKLKTFSPQTVNNRFYTLNESTNAFAVITDVVDATPQANPVHEFEAGKGYMIRSSNFLNPAVNAPLELFEGKFTGVPNNGNYSVPVTHTSAPGSLGFNLIGNPYPSPVSALDFVNANTAVGTLYFWTHGDQNSATNNYATWNKLGVTPVSGPTSPNGLIQTGQGFMAYVPEIVAAGTKVNFTNSMRRDDNSNQFFRSTPVEMHRFWLNLSNTANNSFNQALIGYMEGATNETDTATDGILTYSGTSISSKIAEGSYITQGRSLPFNAADVVPLAFKALTAGDYTIGLQQFDGLFADQDIFLKDSLTGAEQNLKSGAYSFASEAGSFGTRFSIVYQTTLGIKNPTLDANTVVVYKDNGMLHINAGTVTMASVKIFDIRGRLIYERDGIDSTAVSLNDFRAEQQVLLVQITSDENKTVTKKVMN